VAPIFFYSSGPFLPIFHSNFLATEPSGDSTAFSLCGRFADFSRPRQGFPNTYRLTSYSRLPIFPALFFSPIRRAFTLVDRLGHFWFERPFRPRSTNANIFGLLTTFEVRTKFFQFLSVFQPSLSKFSPPDLYVDPTLSSSLAFTIRDVTTQCSRLFQSRYCFLVRLTTIIFSKFFHHTQIIYSLFTSGPNNSSLSCYEVPRSDPLIFLGDTAAVCRLLLLPLIKISLALVHGFHSGFFQYVKSTTLPPKIFTELFDPPRAIEPR